MANQGQTFTLQLNKGRDGTFKDEMSFSIRPLWRSIGLRNMACSSDKWSGQHNLQKVNRLASFEVCFEAQHQNMLSMNSDKSMLRFFARIVPDTI